MKVLFITRRLALLLVAMFAFSACHMTVSPNGKGSQANLNDKDSSTSKGIFIHKVNYPGETVKTISWWYTGTVQNTNKILKLNPKLGWKVLRIGTEVKIDAGLLKKKTELTRAGIKEFNKSKARYEKLRPEPKVTQPADTSSTSTPTVTHTVPQLQKKTSAPRPSPVNVDTMTSILMEKTIKAGEKEKVNIAPSPSAPPSTSLPTTTVPGANANGEHTAAVITPTQKIEITTATPIATAPAIQTESTAIATSVPSETPSQRNAASTATPLPEKTSSPNVTAIEDILS